MILLSSFFIAVFIAVFIPLCAPLPTGDPPWSDGIKPDCAIYNEQNKCPPGHELIDCGDAYPGLWKCSPCKENMYQCDFVTPEYNVKCQPASCPELGKETNVSVVYLKNKTCRVSCVCNEANGYAGKSGATCFKHPVCGLDKELKNGTCVDCSPGFHNPDTDYGPCVAYEPTPPSTTSPVTKSTPSSSPSPSDQGSGQSDIIRFLVPCLVVLFIAVLAVLAVIAWCCRGQTHACNMAFCNSTAIQNSNRQQDQAAEAPENPPPYTCTFLPNGGLPAGTGGQQPNGTPAARPNGTNGIPIASGNQIPSESPNGIPGSPRSVDTGAPANRIPNEEDENGANGSRRSSISERPTPTGTAHPSTRSLASSPDPLNSQDDTSDQFLLPGPLISEGTTLNLPRQTQELRSADPEETKRKMPIPAQDIRTGSDDDDDDDNESQGLLGGGECGLVELDNDRDLSHVPLVH